MSGGTRHGAGTRYLKQAAPARHSEPLRLTTMTFFLP
jgi:hypothetical protein